MLCRSITLLQKLLFGWLAFMSNVFFFIQEIISGYDATHSLKVSTFAGFVSSTLLAGVIGWYLVQSVGYWCRFAKEHFNVILRLIVRPKTFETKDNFSRIIYSSDYLMDSEGRPREGDYEMYFATERMVGWQRENHSEDFECRPLTLDLEQRRKIYA